MNNVNVLTLEEGEREFSPFHKLNSYRANVDIDNGQQCTHFEGWET